MTELPSPISFTINHELGHNLQRQVLEIGWVDTKNGQNMAAANSWANYIKRTGEVSNQIFPYYNIWSYFRYTLPRRSGQSSDDSLLLRYYKQEMTTAFAARQSAYYGLQLSGQQVVLDSNCKTMRSFPIGTRPDVMLHDAGWRDDSYNANEEFRISFYLALPQLSEGQTMSTGDVLTDGRDIYTLLYQAARTFSSIAVDASTWEAQKSILGLNSFSYTDSMYPDTVKSFIGNDFLVIQLCRITGFDYRPYFAAHGVLYTDKANNQITANAQDRPLRFLGQPHLALNRLQPPAVLQAVPLNSTMAYTSNTPYFDATDPETLWPGADDNADGKPEKIVGWHPMQCPGVTH
jgi:hypothetical protein